MGVGSLSPTETGILLDPFSLVRLGAARFDFLVLHDEYGKPLALGRTSRLASFYQRIALFAAELGCTRPGCSRPFNDCEAHHTKPWSDGGPTGMDNLTLLCFDHHRDNCDTRDGADECGHADKDPATGRTGTPRPARQT